MVEVTETERRRNLRALALRMIGGRLPGPLNMRFWIDHFEMRDSECGFAGCVMGWYAYLYPDKDVYVSEPNENGYRVVIVYDDEIDPFRASLLFGIEELGDALDPATYLMEDGTNPVVVGKHVLKILDDYEGSDGQ